MPGEIRYVRSVDKLREALEGTGPEWFTRPGPGDEIVLRGGGVNGGPPGGVYDFGTGYLEVSGLAGTPTDRIVIRPNGNESVTIKSTLPYNEDLGNPGLPAARDRTMRFKACDYVTVQDINIVDGIRFEASNIDSFADIVGGDDPNENPEFPGISDGNYDGSGLAAFKAAMRAGGWEPSRGAVIQRCDITGRGITLIGMWDCKVLNNTIHHIPNGRYGGIYNWRSLNTTIDGNVVHDINDNPGTPQVHWANEGIRTAGHSCYHTITNNHVYNIFRLGRGITEDVVSSWNTVKYNTVGRASGEPAGNQGLSLQYAQWGSRYRHNTVYNATTGENAVAMAIQKYSARYAGARRENLLANKLEIRCNDLRTELGNDASMRLCGLKNCKFFRNLADLIQDNEDGLHKLRDNFFDAHGNIWEPPRNGTNLPEPGAATPTPCTTGVFGNTVEALVGVDDPVDTKRATRYNLSQTADIIKLTARLSGGGLGSGSQQVIKGVIYRDDPDNPGTPRALVAATREITIAASAQVGWVDLPFVDLVRLGAANYWLGLHFGPSSNVSKRYFQIMAESGRANNDSYSDGPSSPFGASGAITTTHNELAIYATYEVV